jgi:hypothetical protein
MYRTPRRTINLYIIDLSLSLCCFIFTAETLVEESVSSGVGPNGRLKVLLLFPFTRFDKTAGPTVPIWNLTARPATGQQHSFNHHFLGIISSDVDPFSPLQCSDGTLGEWTVGATTTTSVASQMQSPAYPLYRYRMERKI